MQDAALDFQETLFLANAHAGRQRLAHLLDADAHLNKLRLYLRLAQQWAWLTAGQYEHVSKMVAEVGRLLGGWIKQTRRVIQALSLDTHTGPVMLSGLTVNPGYG